MTKIGIHLQEIGNESEDVVSANESRVMNEGSNVLLSTVKKGERENALTFSLTVTYILLVGKCFR